jgi:DNA-nicking Smr family endonuclease
MKTPAYNWPVKKRLVKHSDSDADAFAREMADVVPIAPDPRGRVRAAPRTAVPRAVERPADDADSGDDFATNGVDRRELRKLKRGDHPVDARLDLHGLTATEADADVCRFIDASRHQHHRCVCIIHGRGLHSARQVAVLKTRVRTRLRSHPAVLAYVDAPQSDGGPGAVYVLLRR